MLVLFTVLVPVRVCAQMFPQNEFRLEFHSFLQDALRMEHVSGQDGLFTPARAWSYGVALDYQRLLDDAWGIRLNVSYRPMPFAYSAYEDYRLIHGQPDMRYGMARQPLRDHPVLNFGLGLSRDQYVGNGLSVRFGLLFQFVHVGHTDEEYTGHVRVDDTLRVRIREGIVRIDPDRESHRALQLDVALVKRFSYYDFITLGIYRYWSLTGDVFNARHTLYPGMPEEGTAAFAGGVGHFGAMVGYSFTWGPPKEPRHMRKGKRTGDPP
jgi:hypothetical protein